MRKVKKLRVSEAEKAEANQTKKAASDAEGEQYVAWTPAIKRAMRQLEN